MRNPHDDNSTLPLLDRCVIGFAGGLLAGLMMNLFMRSVAAAHGGQEAAGAAPGADRVGRGAQPPQAEANAEDDATVRLAASAYQAVTGDRPPRATRTRLGTLVHYAFSGAVGAFYALGSQQVPTMRIARGAAYGTAVWILADEMVIPFLGLSRGPRELPLGVHAYSLGGHLVYGLTLDAAVQSASRHPDAPEHS